jgi:hypothetical protein
MRAIYDPVTGGLRFEGISGVSGIGIARAPSVQLNPTGYTPSGLLSFANDWEAGWLFENGYQAETFDAGAILTPGLGDQLDQYFIQAGSYTVPIVSGDRTYHSAYTLEEIDSMLYGGSLPPASPDPIAPPIPAVPEPSISIDPLASGIRAIYDSTSGGLVFEGMEGVTSIGIAKASSVELNPGGFKASGEFSFANDYEAGWLFLNGLTSDTFDAGNILTPGLTHELDQYYVQVGTHVVPIVSGDQSYLPAYTLEEIDSMLYGGTLQPTPPATPPGEPTVPNPYPEPSLPVVEIPIEAGGDPILAPQPPAGLPADPVPVVIDPPSADPPAEAPPMFLPEIGYDSPIIDAGTLIQLPGFWEIANLEPPPEVDRDIGFTSLAWYRRQITQIELVAAGAAETPGVVEQTESLPTSMVMVTLTGTNFVDFAAAYAAAASDAEQPGMIPEPAGAAMALVAAAVGLCRRRRTN